MVTIGTAKAPEVKVIGALRNIMMDGDLSAYVKLDTLTKTNLYALGPVADLKGELMIMDGKVYSSEKKGTSLKNKKDRVSYAAMLVYSRVENWKPVSVNAKVENYAALEKLIKATAESEGYDIEKPFVFRISATPTAMDFHVIDWEKGTEHTMENHKQFAYKGVVRGKPVEFLGFYSTRHKSIFTHHTTNMHVHTLEKKSGTVGHLDNVQFNGTITVFLPQQ